MQPDDATVADVARADAAGRLVRDVMVAHHRKLRRYLSQLLDTAETEDAAQEVYARLLNVARGGAHESFGLPYLKRTAEAVALDILRRKRSRFAKAHVELEEALRSPDPTPFDRTRDREGLELLKRAVLDLPPVQRRILLMHRLDEMSLADIAAELRMPLRSVQRHMLRGLTACKAKLERAGWFSNE